MEAAPDTAPWIELGDFTIRYIQVDPASGYALLEWEAPPDVASPPVHVHHRTDEGFYVLVGTFGFLLDDTRTEADAGSHLLVPKGHPHTFWNSGRTPAKCLIILAPADFAGYFAELSNRLPRAASEEQAMQVRRDLAARFDIEVVGVPVTPKPGA